MSFRIACTLTLAAGLTLGTLAGATPPTNASAAGNAISTGQWREDLAQLVSTLERVHPDLYSRADRATFRRHVEKLERAIPELSAEQITVRMMQIVALVEDGHTSLEPKGSVAFGRWFPVRFHRFTDGIHITAVARPHAELAGARVERIGTLSAEEAWARAATVVGSDNAFGSLQRAPLYLANAAVLEALGVVEDADVLSLGIRREDGEPETVRIEAVGAEFDLEFQFWGEMWGPASDAADYVTAFEGRPPTAFYDTDSDLPLHLRHRSAYWFTYLEESKLFYVQIVYLGDSRKETFDAFQERLWKAVDAADIELFVLDNRYNIGGDGSLVRRMVHEVIKRDEINRSGKLFTIVGRATFSAGVMLAASMDHETETVFVGEPMGAYYKHFGDGTSFSLNHSGLLVWVSTIYHQLDAYVGDDRVLPIQLPAPFSSSDYFGGRDPAIDRILASRERPTLGRLFREDGSEAALEAYEQRLREFGGVEWWAPFTMRELNSLGNELRAAGRTDDALAAYRLNARRHPDHWRVWYSLGRALKEQGRTAEAIRHYEKALAADPFNNLAPYQREALAELREAVRDASP